ncbi:TRAM domain-containing protein [Candidatus Woesearchaeota archaeon]|nr:TRAM domain-containing protein [Candidatus Woesearchaeota archaeon]
MYGDRGFREKTAPVRVGDELEVTIDAVGEKGDGVAKKEGFVLFVPNTKKGDRVKIRVTRVLRSVGFAEVVGGKAAGEEEGQQEEGTEGDSEESEEEGSEEAEDEESEDEEDSEAEDTEDFGDEEK